LAPRRLVRAAALDNRQRRARLLRDLHGTVVAAAIGERAVADDAQALQQLA
jgi:hypothetical protein